MVACIQIKLIAVKPMNGTSIPIQPWLVKSVSTTLSFSHGQNKPKNVAILLAKIKNIPAMAGSKQPSDTYIIWMY